MGQKETEKGNEKEFWTKEGCEQKVPKCVHPVNVVFRRKFIKINDFAWKEESLKYVIQPHP